MAVVLPLHAASGVPLDGPRGGTASHLLDLRLAEATDCVEKLKDECARLDALVASKSSAHPKKDAGPPATFAAIAPRTSSSMKEQASPSGTVSRELPTWPLSAVAASMHHALPRVGGSPRIAAKMLAGLGHARAGASPAVPAPLSARGAAQRAPVDDLLWRVDAHSFDTAPAWPHPAASPKRADTSLLDAPYGSARDVQLAAAAFDATVAPRTARMRLLQSQCEDDDTPNQTTRWAPRLTVARARAERIARSEQQSEVPEKQSASSSSVVLDSTISQQQTPKRSLGPDAQRGRFSTDIQLETSTRPSDPDRHRMEFEADIGRGCTVGGSFDPAVEDRGFAGHGGSPTELSTAQRAAGRSMSLGQHIRDAKSGMFRAKALAHERRRSERGVPANKPDLVNTHAIIVELAHSINHKHADEPRLLQLSHALEARAYDLRANDAIRAVALISESADLVASTGHPLLRETTFEERSVNVGKERTAEKLRAIARRLAAAVTSRVLHADARFVADALSALAHTKLGLQEYLDAMLQRLLILLRTEARTFTPPVLARVASAMGKMRNEGGEGGCELCARNGNGYEGKASNQRFLCTFNIRLMEALPDFLEEDMVQLHDGFTDSYLGEEELRKVIDRAAHLQVGLTRATERYRETFRQMVSAGDARFPAFAATGLAAI